MQVVSDMHRSAGQRENEARRLIHEERLHQDKRHGPEQQHDDLEWLTLLMQQVGALAKTINEQHFTGCDNEPHKRQRILEELVNVTATAKAWLEMRV